MRHRFLTAIAIAAAASAFSLPVLEQRGLPFGLQLLGFDRRDRELCARASWVMQNLVNGVNG